MSTSALLACLALLYGIANADPAVFTVAGADPDTAVSATVAAGLKSVSVSLSGLGDRVGPQTPPGGTSHGNAGSAGGTTVATAEPLVADIQPFNVRVDPDANQRIVHVRRRTLRGGRNSRCGRSRALQPGNDDLGFCRRRPHALSRRPSAASAARFIRFHRSVKVAGRALRAGAVQPDLTGCCPGPGKAPS